MFHCMIYNKTLIIFDLDIPGGSEGYFSNDWYSAITNAILNSTSIVETKPSCPTGNCTFPVFSSLGFCSNCVDIAQFMQQNSKCTMGHSSKGHLANCTYWLPPSSSGSNYSYVDGGYWHAYSDSGFNRQWRIYQAHANGPYSFADAPAFFTKFLFVFGSNSIDAEEIRLSNGEIISSSFASIVLIKFAPQTGSADRGFVNTAHICALSVCAKEYNISMTSGLFQFKIVSTSYSKLTRHHFDGVHAGNSSYTFAFSNKDNDFTFIANGTTTLLLEGFWEDKLTDYLRDFLEGELYIKSDWFGYTTALRGKLNIFQSALNASIDIPKTMDRFVEAMTNRLRDMSDHTVQGQSRTMELYIRISCYWAVLPVSCIFFGTIFLV